MFVAVARAGLDLGRRERGQPVDRSRSGVYGNYLRESIERAGLDPDNLPEGEKARMSFSNGHSKAKAWKDIWGAGQGVGQIDDIPAAGAIVYRLAQEYFAAKERFVA